MSLLEKPSACLVKFEEVFLLVCLPKNGSSSKSVSLPIEAGDSLQCLMRSFVPLVTLFSVPLPQPWHELNLGSQPCSILVGGRCVFQRKTSFLMKNAPTLKAKLGEFFIFHRNPQIISQHCDRSVVHQWF